MAKHVELIGYASGNGAGNTSCCMGPVDLQDSPFLKASGLDYDWSTMLYNREDAVKAHAASGIAEMSTRLGHITQTLTEQNQLYAVIGGDHTSAIGTWSGAAAGIADKGDLGLIWIDAHMDSHTPLTSPSQNIHGMPHAILLGHGERHLTHVLTNSPKVLPQNTCLIGVRSYEPEEEQLLKNLNIRIFYMEDIEKQGFNAVIQEALMIAAKNTAGFGVSLDLDAIDPTEAPGVTLPVENGLKTNELLAGLKKITRDKKFLGIDIAEFNPYADKDKKTEQLIIKILTTIFT